MGGPSPPPGRLLAGVPELCSVRMVAGPLRLLAFLAFLERAFAGDLEGQILADRGVRSDLHDGVGLVGIRSWT